MESEGKEERKKEEEERRKEEHYNYGSRNQPPTIP